MSGISLEIDTTKISLKKLKELYRHFEKMQRFGGGYGQWLLLLEKAIDEHPETVSQEVKPETSVKG